MSHRPPRAGPQPAAAPAHLLAPARRHWLRRCALHAVAPLAGAGGLASAGALTGCAAPAATQLRHAAPADLPRQVQLAHVPFVAAPPDDTLCGPAALAMLLGATGRPADLGRLSAEVHLPQRQGSLALEMTAALRRHGLLPCALAPSLADALRELAAGHAVLVLLNLSLPIWPRWHYAVLTGYDLAASSVRLHSGAQANAVWPLDTFEHTWARSQHWARVALPPEQLPATVQEAPLTQALLDFERLHGPAATLPGWLAGAERLPQAWLIRMAAGNALLAQARPAEALPHYEAATGLRDSAASWNNRAITLARLGRMDEARAALLRAEALALEREPAWQDAVAQTRRELGR